MALHHVLSMVRLRAEGCRPAVEARIFPSFIMYSPLMLSYIALKKELLAAET